MRPGRSHFRDSLRALMQVVLQGIDNAKKTSKQTGPCQHRVGVVGRSVGEAQVTAASATGLQRGGLGRGTRPAEGERQALLRVKTRVRVMRILYRPLTSSWLQSGVSSKESSAASGS